MPYTLDPKLDHKGTKMASTREHIRPGIICVPPLLILALSLRPLHFNPTEAYKSYYDYIKISAPTYRSS